MAFWISLAEYVISSAQFDILCKLCYAARILRGLRIAGRLGLSISKDTEIAILKLSSSIINLAKVLLCLRVK